MDLTHKSELISYLKAHHLWSKKSLGQNFLVDRNILNKIVDSAEFKESDTVLEIGPGVGTLTWEIAQMNRQGLLLAIEKDFKFVQILRGEFKNWQQVKIVHEDIRRFDLCSVEGPYKVVANIPYYLTSPLIRKLLEGRCQDKNPKSEIGISNQIRSPNVQNHKPSLIILTLQKEVAERITAKPGDSNRGLLTIMVELLAEAEIISQVSRSSFYPEPEVDSAILRVRPGFTDHGQQIQTMDDGRWTVDPVAVLHVAKAGFSSKRRQLHNSLAGGLRVSASKAEKLLKDAHIDPQKRAEDLTIQEWFSLAKTWLTWYNESSV